jgi:hypothetical protein
MTKEEIEDYFKRVDELGAKLTGEDKETYDWLIYGCNQCAKLLNEKEQQCKKQKEVINNFLDIVDKSKMLLNNPDLLDLYLKIKEVSE